MSKGLAIKGLTSPSPGLTVAGSSKGLWPERLGYVVRW